jgi:hypothetical protein
MPLAICCPVVDNVIAEPQTPELPPVTLLQLAVTAELGTVLQPLKFADPDLTFKVHVLELDPLEVVQLTVDVALPGTLPRSGSVEVKLIVLGVAVTVPRLTASGVT